MLLKGQAVASNPFWKLAGNEPLITEKDSSRKGLLQVPEEA